MSNKPKRPIMMTVQYSQGGQTGFQQRLDDGLQRLLNQAGIDDAQVIIDVLEAQPFVQEAIRKSKLEKIKNLEAELAVAKSFLDK